MNHWKLTLSYNGSGFHGWQVQPGLVTVQGTLAKAIEAITGEQVLPQGAGRTDAGVHALAQVASFALESPIPPGNLQRALNRKLPAGLRVLAAELVPPSFHARHSTRGKVYEYRVFERRFHATRGTEKLDRICSPFLAPFVWDCPWPLALGPLQGSAALLIGTQDFSAMAAAGRISRSEDGDIDPNIDPKNRPSTKPNPVKTIHAASWARHDGLLTFRIQGSGFLHHMVRNLVGTMVDIGRGSLRADELPRILGSRDRSQAGPTAPASGLFLVEVLYPAEDTQTAVEALTLATIGAGA